MAVPSKELNKGAKVRTRKDGIDLYGTVETEHRNHVAVRFTTHQWANLDGPEQVVLIRKTNVTRVDG